MTTRRLPESTCAQREDDDVFSARAGEVFSARLCDSLDFEAARFRGALVPWVDPDSLAALEAVP